jgi:RimJ/RimL family protein N-acetyltransferase
MTPTSTAQALDVLMEAVRSRGVPCTSSATPYGLISKTDIGTFELHFLPGNRRTLVSHGVVINPAHRGKGEGTRLCKLREEAAKVAGVTLLLATVRNDNVAEICVLEKCRWTRLTNNLDTQCSLWGKTL